MMNLFSVVQWGPEFTCSPRPTPHIAFDIVGCRTPPWASPARVVIRASSARVDRAPIDVEARTAGAGKHHFRSELFFGLGFFSGPGIPQAFLDGPSGPGAGPAPTGQSVRAGLVHSTSGMGGEGVSLETSPIFFTWCTALPGWVVNWLLSWGRPFLTGSVVGGWVWPFPSESAALGYRVPGERSPEKLPSWPAKLYDYRALCLQREGQ